MQTNDDIGTIAICICTYNRVAYLKKCLDQLIPQLRSSRIVLTVIDNNSTDGTKSYVQSLMAANASIRYLYEPQQGLSYARNTAWKTSQSEWLLYLDDDCLPSDRLIQSALNIIWTSNSIAAFGGPIDAIFQDEIPGWLPEKFGCFSMPFEKQTVIENGFIRGGCFMVLRSVLVELNGFDKTLGVTGDSLHYGEEIELQLRMRKVGHKIAYDPSLRTGHFVRTDKLNMGWVLRSEYARRRDKMLFEPVSFMTAFGHLIKTTLGRFFWIPVHLMKAIFNRRYTFKKAFFQIAQPMAYRVGEWVGVLIQKSRK